MENKYTVKMTPNSYMVYNWVHNLPRKQVKIGANGFRLGNRNQPYMDGKVLYNLPVPGVDVSDYEFDSHTSYYDDAIVYRQTGYDPIKITSYRIVMGYSYDDNVSLDAARNDSDFYPKRITAIYLEDPRTECLLTYWTELGGIEPFLVNSTIMITSYKRPWVLADMTDDSLLAILTDMANNVEDFFASIKNPSRYTPSKPGVYLTKAGQALCHLPNGNWLLDTARYNSTELTWEQVQDRIPKDEFPLQYRGQALWN